MTHSEAQTLADDLVLRSEAVYLSNIDKRGRPQTRAMLNLRNGVLFPGLTRFFATRGERFTAYFSTNTSSPKVADLRARSAVSVYYCLPKEFIGLMLGGDMEVLSDREIRHALWQPGWNMYYPGGPDDPDYTVLRLVPSEAKLYHQLQTVSLL